jgi:hypothetical protein
MCETKSHGWTRPATAEALSDEIVGGLGSRSQTCQSVRGISKSKSQRLLQRYQGTRCRTSTPLASQNWEYRRSQKANSASETQTTFNRSEFQAHLYHVNPSRLLMYRAGTLTERHSELYWRKNSVWLGLWTCIRCSAAARQACSTRRPVKPLRRFQLTRRTCFSFIITRGGRTSPAQPRLGLVMNAIWKCMKRLPQGIALQARSRDD